ncbi:prepilin-type N-terminal cleavage/methylation domain-containing protein, partial [Candidatus Roizmanbacteria bacterium]|nr:prepilin-type N-terminal cleavage/methylation domain-containing protein [Candidatus Roizmanbacteria bacterium]
MRYFICAGDASHTRPHRYAKRFGPGDAGGRNTKSGFTLTELLIVVSIISVLIIGAGFSFNQALRRAREHGTRTQLEQVKAAIFLLERDTGNWPGGCPPRTFANPEFSLETDQGPGGVLAGGIRNLPVVGSYGDPECQWTAQEVADWHGPYLNPDTPLVDTWGQDFVFDPDYHGRTHPTSGCINLGCCTPESFDGVALLSSGIDTVAYTCDDIAVPLCIEDVTCVP